MSISADVVHSARTCPFEMTADVHARMHEFFGKRIGKHLLPFGATP